MLCTVLRHAHTHTHTQTLSLTLPPSLRSECKFNELFALVKLDDESNTSSNRGGSVFQNAPKLSPTWVKLVSLPPPWFK